MNIDKAREIYNKILTKITPGFVEAVIKYANFERRLGDLRKVESIYEENISSTYLKQAPKALAYLSMHYARFVDYTLKNTTKAREIYKRALEKAASVKNLWLSYINFEIAQGGSDVEERVCKLFDSALQAVDESTDKTAAAEDKPELYTKYIEFLSDYGRNIERFRKVKKAFHSLFPTQTTPTGDSKKRPLEGGEANQKASKYQRVGYQQSTYSTPYASYPTSNPAPLVTTTATAAAAAAQIGAAANYYGQYAGYANPYAGYPGATAAQTGAAGYPYYQYPYATPGAATQYAATNAGYSASGQYNYT